MRRLLIPLTCLALALAVPRPALAQAADSSDLFYNAYTANEQGEALETAGDARQALSKFRYAASLLEQISKADPAWRAEIVAYRKKRVRENILHAQQQLPAGAAAVPDRTPDAAPAPPMEGELPQKEGAAPPDSESADATHAPGPCRRRSPGSAPAAEGNAAEAEGHAGGKGADGRPPGRRAQAARQDEGQRGGS